MQSLSSTQQHLKTFFLYYVTDYLTSIQHVLDIMSTQSNLVDSMFLKPSINVWVYNMHEIELCQRLQI